MKPTHCIILLALMLPSGITRTLNAAADEYDIEFAMQNPFLRDLFRDRELRIAYGPFDRPSRRLVRPPVDDDRDDFMLEMRIDQMVRLFLRKVIEEKKDLGTSIEAVGRAALEFRGKSEGASEKLRQTLESLAAHAGSLRSTLASVISDLPEKADYEPRIGADSKRDGFAVEIAFLEEQTRNTSNRINSFFFRPGATVSVSELKGDDMMVSLHKIQLMASRLAEAVKER